MAAAAGAANRRLGGTQMGVSFFLSSSSSTAITSTAVHCWCRGAGVIACGGAAAYWRGARERRRRRRAVVFFFLLFFLYYYYFLGNLFSLLAAMCVSLWLEALRAALADGGRRDMLARVTAYYSE